MEHQIKFSEKVIVPKILTENKDLQDLKLVKAEAKSNSHIDGFMGSIIFLTMEFETVDKRQEKREIVIKLMKPPSPTRHLFLADKQFTNEVYIYRTVVPTFIKKFSDKFRTINKALWCPRVYLAEVDQYPELSNELETVLALENIAPLGYRLGNRSHLSPEELMLMTKAIAQYHACTYAMRITGDKDLDKLIAGIIPLTFTQENGDSFYQVVFEIAFARLFKYLDETPEEIDDEHFRKNLNSLRARYASHPLKLMERFRRTDEIFSVILHGDYNRNNVLFKYDTVNGKETPVDLRFIDFQEVRYGTPVIDLTFFMYMNIEKCQLKTNLFERLLENYHNCLIKSLCELLSCEEDDTRLDAYRYEHFYSHVKQFAFYGAMVSIHFLPWMNCSETDCERLSYLFEHDMRSKEFRDVAMTCGGKEVNERITEVARHASKFGFMDMIETDD